ncbi:MAG TPA: hypothetical protein VN253_09255 [Kofleriaceae bacterium]|nr:hypothetical protein [Kofleriaceae bacterium]
MSTDSIDLRLVNQSADCNNSSVLIFQKNVATNFDELAIAWQVIEHLGAGWIHPFQYELELQVGAGDSWGNYVPRQNSPDGQLWTVSMDCSGNQLQKTGPASSPSEVQVLNGLEQGAITACMYRSGKLLATKTGVAPGQKAVFVFKPTIWIGVVSQVEQGQVLDSAIMSNVNTQLNLTGISSADIVMTGGGPGRNSRPFSFTLQNVKRAS